MPSAIPALAVDLRPWSEGDLDLLQRLLGDPLMTEHLGGPETPEQIRDRHQRYLSIQLETNDRMFVIVIGAQRRSAGSIGYWEKDWQEQRVLETGWSVLPDYQGRGVATAATILIVERARIARLHRFLHAFPSVENPASNAVCRKAGFILQGEADFEYPKGHFMRCNDWRFDLAAE